MSLLSDHPASTEFSPSAWALAAERLLGQLARWPLAQQLLRERFGGLMVEVRDKWESFRDFNLVLCRTFFLTQRGSNAGAACCVMTGLVHSTTQKVVGGSH